MRSFSEIPSGARELYKHHDFEGSDPSAAKDAAVGTSEVADLRAVLRRLAAKWREVNL